MIMMVGRGLPRAGIRQRRCGLCEGRSESNCSNTGKEGGGKDGVRSLIMADLGNNGVVPLIHHLCNGGSERTRQPAALHRINAQSSSCNALTAGFFERD